MCGQRLRSIAGIKRKKHRILYAQQTGVKLEEPGEGEEEEELQEYEAVAPAKRLLTDRRRDEIKETTSSVATGKSTRPSSTSSFLRLIQPSATFCRHERWRSCLEEAEGLQCKEGSESSG